MTILRYIKRNKYDELEFRCKFAFHSRDDALSSIVSWNRDIVWEFIPIDCYEDPKVYNFGLVYDEQTGES